MNNDLLMSNHCATCRHWRGTEATYRADCATNGAATAFNDGCGAWAAKGATFVTNGPTDLIVGAPATAVRPIPVQSSGFGRFANLPTVWLVDVDGTDRPIRKGDPLTPNDRGLFVKAGRSDPICGVADAATDTRAQLPMVVFGPYVYPAADAFDDLHLDGSPDEDET
jgi:hypothetical protein